MRFWQQRRFPVIRIKIQNGRLQVMGMGAWYSYWRDPYHLMLTIPWSGFLALLAFAYLMTNTVFACLYLAQPNSIENADPNSFLDAFFFSVQTLASIGYGAMYPRTVYANAIVTLEATIGLVAIALATGLAFARFARPTARVLFSRVAVIAPYHGIPTFTFRAANQRGNQILEAQLRVYLMRDEISPEGYAMRRFHALKLLRHRTPSFSLSWTVMHPIDENSPFYGSTAESLAQQRVSIVASLTGIDETVSQAIHARHNYAPQEILWNHQFMDIFHDTPNGNRYIDYTHFHEVFAIAPKTP